MTDGATFRKQDLEIILSGAAALQTREVSAKAIAELNGIPDSGEGVYPIEVAYELAESFSITPEYVKRFVETRFPSRERMLETAKSIGSFPTTQALEKCYAKELLEALRRASPGEVFDFSTRVNGYSKFARVVDDKRIVQRGFLGRKKSIIRVKKKIDLAHINNIWANSVPKKCHLSITIYDPFFAESCKDKLNELKARFSPWEDYEIIQDYSF